MAIDGAGGLHFRLHRDARRAFLLLVLGHLLYAIALYGAMSLEWDLGNIWITPLYGLPLLVAGPRDRLAIRALVLIVGLTAIHYAAVQLAQTSVKVPFTNQGYTDSPWVPGAIGGAVGAAGSLALCAVARLLRPGSRLMCVLGTLLLTALGSFGVYMALFRPGPSAASTLLLYWIYTPWQLAFAYVLAKVLR